MGEIEKIKEKLYIESDFQGAIEGLDKLWSEKNRMFKHKCERSEQCYCIELGRIAVEAGGKAAIAKYFYNFSLDAPFSLFKEVVEFFIEEKEYSEARALLNQYFLYTKEIKEDGGKNALTKEQYEQIFRIFIFKLALPFFGAQNAIVKVQSSKLDQENKRVRL